MSMLENIPDTAWKEIYKKKIKTISDSLSSIREKVNELGWDEEMYDILSQPYYEELDKIYAEELPLIKAEENSDVLFHLVGPSITADSPRTSMVRNFLGTVSSEIKKLTKAIAGVKNNRKRLPKEFDLSMTGYAGGSLYLGFSLLEEDIEKNVLEDEDVLLKSTREAIKTLGTITKYADDLENQELKKEIEDPRIRDHALSTLKELSPSSRSGIKKITLTGKSINDSKKRELSNKTRKEARRIIREKIIKGDTEEFTGLIREIDLDAKRFEMRSILGAEVDDIRCIYPKDLEDQQVKKWLNERVKVIGKVEYDTKKRPKLIQVHTVDIM